MVSGEWAAARAGQRFSPPPPHPSLRGANNLLEVVKPTTPVQFRCYVRRRPRLPVRFGERGSRGAEG
uniref:Uncharacterized protein n=1 Tax=Setaria viridis TaxID=4556 RepID=A0A4U6VRI3_SETVI|nr:hypothetical protein SEVIR_2G035550v2 [Setaria viridis]